MINDYIFKKMANKYLFTLFEFGDGDTLSYIEKQRKIKKKKENNFFKSVPVPKKHKKIKNKKQKIKNIKIN